MLEILMLLTLSFSVFCEEQLQFSADKTGQKFLSGESLRHKVEALDPKKISQKLRGELLLVDYKVGEFGTSKLVTVINRIVIYKNKVIIDAPYRYLGDSDPKWVIDETNRLIKIKDPVAGSRTVNY